MGTRNQLLTAIACSILSLPAAFAQFDSVSVGTWDGTALLGNENTPFATNTGSNNRRGQRVQYIFHADELLAAGLMPGLITGFAFVALERENVLGSDSACAFIDCPEIRVDARMGNSVLNDFGPYVASQPVPTNVDWDAPVKVSPAINSNSNLPFTVDSGLVEFPLAGGGFNWVGSNLVLDISWLRSVPNGSSPPVQLVEDLPFTATKWVQVTENANIDHGNTYQDDPLTESATTGTTFNRPVIWFYGYDYSTAIGREAESDGIRVRYSDADGAIVITRDGGNTQRLGLQCLDITGRLIVPGTLPEGVTRAQIPLGAVASGTMIITATTVDGTSRSLGRIVIP